MLSPSSSSSSSSSSILTKLGQLDRLSLTRTLKHYGLNPQPDLPFEKLLSMASRCFEKSDVSDREVLEKFYFSGDERGVNTTTRGYELARPGEQVAAKVLRSHEDGSWILANVLDFDVHTQTFEVQDEDDANRIATLPTCDVRRLEDTAVHFRRHDKVLAVFPDTTSFYRAVIVKTPKPPSSNSSNWEVIVRFDDDEDESGRAPPRRIPARFVIPDISYD